MSTENKDFLNFFNLINSHIDYIIEHRKSKADDKDIKDSKNELLDDFKLSIDFEILQNAEFLKFFDLVWNNYEDKEKCEKELKSHLDEQNKKFNQATVLEKAIIAYQLLTKTAEGFKLFSFIRKLFLIIKILFR